VAEAEALAAAAARDTARQAEAVAEALTEIEIARNRAINAGLLMGDNPVQGALTALQAYATTLDRVSGPASPLAEGDKPRVHSPEMDQALRSGLTAMNDPNLELGFPECARLDRTWTQFGNAVRVLAPSRDGGAVFYGTDDGEVGVLGGFSPSTDGYRIRSLELHPKGTYLAAGDLDGRILLWDTSQIESFLSADPCLTPTRDEAPDSGRTAQVATAFPPPAKTLYVDGPVPGGPTIESSPQLGLGQEGVASLAFAPDNSWLVSGDNRGRVRLWQYEGVAVVECLLSQFGDDEGPVRVNSIAFSRDGSTLAVSGGGDIRIWRVGIGFPGEACVGGTSEGPASVDTSNYVSLPQWVPPGSDGSNGLIMLSVALNEDGSRLGVGTPDGPVYVWSLPEDLVQPGSNENWSDALPKWRPSEWCMKRCRGGA
jgi:WD40 repeat protein